MSNIPLPYLPLDDSKGEITSPLDPTPGIIFECAYHFLKYAEKRKTPGLYPYYLNRLCWLAHWTHFYNTGSPLTGRTEWLAFSNGPQSKNLFVFFTKALSGCDWNEDKITLSEFEKMAREMEGKKEDGPILGNNKDLKKLCKEVYLQYGRSSGNYLKMICTNGEYYTGMPFAQRYPLRKKHPEEFVYITPSIVQEAILKEKKDRERTKQILFPTSTALVVYTPPPQEPFLSESNVVKKFLSWLMK